MLPRRITYLILAFFFIVLAGETVYLYWLEHQPKEEPCDPLIAQVARETGVDPFLIRALIWRESRFDPMTHGEAADERGLMQVTPEVGEMWAKATKNMTFSDDLLYDPETNIRAGTWYLNLSLKRWSQTDDPAAFALAEYNAGHSNAVRWVDPDRPLSHTAFLERITYPATRKYVEVILEQRDKFRAAFAKNRWYRDSAAVSPAVTLTP